ncbi:hypothetical protein HDU98_011929 [Podochytrium sp. JEL0797]|nr:hypothetical protein HDU98_011929 [Podochytrium sp. JEL0797]
MAATMDSGSETVRASLADPNIPMIGFWALPPSKTWKASPRQAESPRQEERVAVKDPVAVTAPASPPSIEPTATTITPISVAVPDSPTPTDQSNHQLNHKEAPDTSDTTTSTPRFILAILASSAAIIGGAYGVDHVCNKIPRRAHHSADTLHENEFLREYVNSTFEKVGLAISVTATSAFLISQRLTVPKSKVKMHGFHPVVFLGSLAACGVFANLTLTTPLTEPDRKRALFLATAVTKGIFFSSTIAFSPAILTRVGLYAVGVVGSLSWVAYTAKSNHYVYIGGPLLTGVTVATLAAASPFLLPASAIAIPVYQVVWIYGGVAVLSGLLLRDLEKVIHNGEKVESGEKERDTINEAMNLYLDIVNVLP